MSSATSFTVPEMNMKAVECFRRGSFERAVSWLDQALGYLNSTACLGERSTDGMDQSETSSVQAGSVYSDASGSTRSRPDAAASFSGLSASLDSHKNVVCEKTVLQQEVRGNGKQRGMIRSVSTTSCPLRTKHHQAATNVFEFYSRFLVFEAHRARGISKSRLLCVVFFNMGVCYHSEAIRLQNVGSPPPVYGYFYQYALQLYNMSQLSLHNSWGALNCEDENQTLVLGLALSNNSGHIHHLMGNFRESRYCLDAIQHFIQSTKTTTPENKEQNELSTTLSPQDQGFFLRTAIIFEDRNLHIAPSA
ncbi:unknown protein [Seminavis robusta]|uniref:Uncharacterized protein n=1 Tax=Seminavis robusta TaxID=568900 RepID=A0A9N8E7Z4_9STRA|nr:unknown protein [Seminavis robusta]|eukprot:Sro647_g180920.1 n/a (306) ;mRNA; r:30800-31717